MSKEISYKISKMHLKKAYGKFGKTFVRRDQQILSRTRRRKTKKYTRQTFE